MWFSIVTGSCRVVDDYLYCVEDAVSGFEGSFSLMLEGDKRGRQDLLRGFVKPLRLKEVHDLVFLERDHS
jgi:hypothetical protein